MQTSGGIYKLSLEVMMRVSVHFVGNSLSVAWVMRSRLFSRPADMHTIFLLLFVTLGFVRMWVCPHFLYRIDIVLSTLSISDKQICEFMDAQVALEREDKLRYPNLGVTAKLKCVYPLLNRCSSVKRVLKQLIAAPLKKSKLPYV
jgi:hypothetical protein